jgi:hypothetical protein
MVSVAIFDPSDFCPQTLTKRRVARSIRVSCLVSCEANSLKQIIRSMQSIFGNTTDCVFVACLVHPSLVTFSH